MIIKQDNTLMHRIMSRCVHLQVWSTIMASVEWNKKEELVAEQALKHLKTYSPLLAAVAKSSKAELSLLVRIQEYCYDNMNFMKSFQKIVVMLYKSRSHFFHLVVILYNSRSHVSHLVVMLYKNMSLFSHLLVMLYKSR